MNTHLNSRHVLISAVGILVLIMSMGNSGRVLAAQNMADLAVTIVADKSRVKIGENIIYTVTAINQGPDAALSVGVSHGLSDQLNFVSVTCGQGISSDGSFCEYSILQLGERVVSTLVATPNPSVSKQERNALTATATISFQTDDTVDSDSGNNWASVTVKLIGRLTH